MAFNTVPSVAPLDSWTSSQHNTYIKDNFAALWVGTTAGDMDYYTASNTKSRLPLSSGGLLTNNGVGPQWLVPVDGGLLQSSAGGPSYLSPGAANTFIRSTGNAPVYSGLVTERQGGSATNWQSTGTTGYTPSSTIIKSGSIVVTSGTLQSVTYAVAFNYRPIIFLSISSSSGQYTISHTSDSVSGFDIMLIHIDGGAVAKDINWIAIGQ